MQSDIFDAIDLNQKSDLFDELENDPKKADVFDDTADITSIVKAELSKVKPLQKIIERIIEKPTIKNIHIPVQMPPPPPLPQIIRETRVEVQVEKKDPTKYVEESKYLDLLVKISKFETQLKETRRMAEFPLVLGGSGVIGIPPPEGNNGKVLTVVSNQAKWQTATGGTSSDIYTPTNVTTDRSFDATSTSIDELANVLGSLIVSLQGAGIIR